MRSTNIQTDGGCDHIGELLEEIGVPVSASFARPSEAFIGSRTQEAGDPIADLLMLYGFPHPAQAH